jgi:hypothetical protein
MRLASVALVLAACWTGSAPQPAPITGSAPPEPTSAPAMRFRVKLERTPCLGMCPVFTIVIHGNGHVEWTGLENVAAIGHVDGKRLVARAELEKLARQVEDAKFFERDENGDLPAGPVCTTSGGTTTCSYSAHFCSDTSHTKLTVTRGVQTHSIDNDHCDPKPGIDDLEDAIERLAGAAELVGR